MKKVNLKKIKKIHFTGIKGVGMTALALCARDMGINVSGSDIDERFVTDKTLEKAGILWKSGFKKENIGSPDLLVFTAAHSGQINVEVVAAETKGIPVLSHAQALGLFMSGKTGISVCGVGGKTTTSAIISTIFSSAGFNPSFAVGAGLINLTSVPGRYSKKGKHFIAEADEYFTSPQDQKPRFYYQNPKILVITNIAFDHPDVYKNLKQTFGVFKTFSRKVPESGLIAVCLDTPNNLKFIKSIKGPVVTYGFSNKADWRITLINQSKNKVSFSLRHNDLLIDNLTLGVLGRFNIRNAAAAVIVANFCGIPISKIRKGLKEFKGAKRRFELIKKVNGIKIFDDYAHHPIQIQAILAAAKKLFKKKRILVIFQPHTYSRTKALFKDFGQSFSDADLVVVTDIYASAREKKDFQISGRLLVQQINTLKSNAVYKHGEKEVAGFLQSKAKKGDIIFTLGAGDIFNWHESIAKAIESNQ